MANDWMVNAMPLLQIQGTCYILAFVSITILDKKDG